MGVYDVTMKNTHTHTNYLKFKKILHLSLKWYSFLVSSICQFVFVVLKEKSILLVVFVVLTELFLVAITFVDALGFPLE